MKQTASWFRGVNGAIFLAMAACLFADGAMAADLNSATAQWSGQISAVISFVKIVSVVLSVFSGIYLGLLLKSKAGEHSNVTNAQLIWTTVACGFFGGFSYFLQVISGAASGTSSAPF